MKLSFDDDVGPRIFLLNALQAVGIVIAAPVAFFKLSQTIAPWLSVTSKDELSGITIIITVSAVALWFFLNRKFDLLGLFRMSREKILSVAGIEFEPEKLLIRGHQGFLRTFPRQGLVLTKETRSNRFGRPSCYIIVQPAKGERAEFFIGYSEEETAAVLKAFAETDPRQAPMEMRADFSSLFETQTLPEEDAPASLSTVSVPEKDKSMPPKVKARELAYFPLETSPFWLVLFTLAIAWLLCQFTIEKIFFSQEKFALWATLTLMVVSGGMAALCVSMLLSFIKDPIGASITPACLRVKYKFGKNIEYDYTRYNFAQNFLVDPSNMHATYRIIILRDGNQVDTLRFGRADEDCDDGAEVFTAFFKELQSAHRKAKKSGCAT